MIFWLAHYTSFLAYKYFHLHFTAGLGTKSVFAHRFVSVLSFLLGLNWELLPDGILQGLQEWERHQRRNSTKAHPLPETQIQALFSSCKHATEWRQQPINALSVFVLQWPSWMSWSFGKRVVAPQEEPNSITNVFLWATSSTDSSFCFWGNVCEGTQGRYAGSSTPDPTSLSHVNHLSVITQQVNLIVQAGTWKTKAATCMWGLKWLASAENCPTWDNHVPFCEWAGGSPSEELQTCSISFAKTNTFC